MEKKAYRFYGWQTAGPEIRELYDRFLAIWAEDTCAPRLRKDWSPQNPTVGHCSITSFLVQDLYGGKVYGVQLPDGSYHCYNDINGTVFDLTSEQFQGEVLPYENNPEQFREEHFKDEGKYQRYLLLKERFEKANK